MKKSILILTSLSATEKNVAEAGLELAKQHHTNLIVLNCDVIISAISYYQAFPMNDPMERNQRRGELDLLVKHLTERAEAGEPKEDTPKITSFIMEGDLDSNVKEILDRYPVEMIVMGAQSGSFPEHFLFGSETKVITQHTTVPTLLIPSNWKQSQIKKITFATKFLEQDEVALQYMVNLSKQLSARMEIVNVRKYGKKDLSYKSPLLEVIEKVCMSNPKISYHTVFGKHVVPRINKYCKETGSELLALSRDHHSFLFQLVKESTIDKYLSGHKIPLLILPPMQAAQQEPVDQLESLTSIEF
jgi:nucleotide-binding universal stress UspA family protein